MFPKCPDQENWGLSPVIVGALEMGTSGTRVSLEASGVALGECRGRRWGVSAAVLGSVGGGDVRAGGVGRRRQQ